MAGKIDRHTGLAVIESRWWKSGNDSVRPLFETLAGIVEDNPHSVRYDMFTEERSLSQTIQNVADNTSIHSIYIGAHGGDAVLCGLAGAEISRTQLRNMFVNSNTNATITGLYFGSCLIANKQNASFLLSVAANTGLQWIAGYTKKVDWIDSSAVDMIFWSKYLHERRTNRSRKKGKLSDLKMVKAASLQMKNLMPTIFTEMGFNLYYLDTGGTLESVW